MFDFNCAYNLDYLDEREVLKLDFRKRETLNWFNENYFVSVYCSDDINYFSFEDLESCSKFFKISVEKILRNIRTGEYILINNEKYRFYFIHKEDLDINVNSRRII